MGAMRMRCKSWGIIAPSLIILGVGFQVLPAAELTAVAPEATSALAEKNARDNSPTIRNLWLDRIERNGGVHPWTRRHAGKHVFQEWVALLSEHRNSDAALKRKIGLELENYVVGGDISALSDVGTSLPIPGYTSGDFDMALLGCVSLLGLFEEDRLLLTDETFIHLIRRVIRLWGQTPKMNFEVFFLSFPETENHLFMTESARYLTNGFIWRNSRDLPTLAVLRTALIESGFEIHNDKGQVHRLLMGLMHQIMRNGFFEFNAQIYQRFTLHALANLYSFARDENLQAAAGSLLDYVSAVFAFQSMDFIRYPPYRRSSEKFLDSSLISSDATCSFFAAQGLEPDELWPFTELWKQNWAHASLALWSVNLKYRVPDAIMDYMRGKRGDYLFESRLRFRAGSHWQTTSEKYFTSPNFLLSAGGKYQGFEGRNFPTYQSGLREAPWVYDVVSRSTTALIRPSQTLPRNLNDVLHFRGRQWRDNNLALHENFAFGYARVHEPLHAWPHSIPQGWRPTYTDKTRDFDFRFYHLPAQGVYVVLGRLKRRDTFWKRWWTRYALGTVEVVDTGRVNSLEALRSVTLAGQKDRGFGHRHVYRTFSGDEIKLNSRYGPRTQGIEKVMSALAPAMLPPVTLLPFRFPWTEPSADKTSPRRLYPLLWPRMDLAGAAIPMLVTQTYPRREVVAYSDGTGNLFVHNPALGQALIINYSQWWRATRQVVLFQGLSVY